MSSRASHRVYLYADADNATVGLWCDGCQLPSVIEFPILAMTFDGISQAGTHQMCMDCDEDGEDLDDDGGQADDLVRL